MEAVASAGFSAIILSASILLLNEQAQLAKNARDMALVQDAVSQDVNAIRLYARSWYWRNSFLDKPQQYGANPPDMMVYSPGLECLAFASKGSLEVAARAESWKLPGYIPGALAINVRSRLIPSSAANYEIRREVSTPTVTQSSEVKNSTSVMADDEVPLTLRIKYTVRYIKTSSDGTKTPADIPFDRTADVLFPAQLSC